MTPTPRILFVSRFFPRDRQHVQGVYMRQSMWIEALARVGELRFLFYVDERVPTGSRALAQHERRLERRWDVPVSLRLCRYSFRRPETRWEAYVAPATSFFAQGMYRTLSRPAQVGALAEELDARPDLVFAHRLDAMAPLLRAGRPTGTVLLDLDDVEHLARFRRIGQPPTWPGKKLEYLQLPALWWGERKAVARARRTYVCSDRDRVYLERQGFGDLAIVPNAVHVPPEPSPPTASPALLFIGVYTYLPNRNAAHRLALELWPRIREHVPNGRLILAGAGEERFDRAVKSQSGVEVTGFVDDLEALYARTRVVACPIREGGGTRIKILEAAAHGRPVVSTTIGAEGIDFRDGEEILLRDAPDAFAAACAELLLDEDRGRQIGRAAREACRSLYDRPSVVDSMEEGIRSELGSAGS